MHCKHVGLLPIIYALRYNGVIVDAIDLSILDLYLSVINPFNVSFFFIFEEFSGKKGKRISSVSVCFLLCEKQKNVHLVCQI